MSFDLQLQSAVGQENAGDLCKLLPRTRLEICAGGVEQHVGEVHDQPPSALAGFEDLIELLAELIAQFGFLTLRFRRIRFGREPR